MQARWPLISRSIFFISSDFRCFEIRFWNSNRYLKWRKIRLSTTKYSVYIVINLTIQTREGLNENPTGASYMRTFTVDYAQVLLSRYLKTYYIHPQNLIKNLWIGWKMKQSTTLKLSTMELQAENNFSWYNLNQKHSNPRETGSTGELRNL